MNCKNLKIKINKDVVCRITNKKIDFKYCTTDCENYVQKEQKSTKFSKKCANLKTKTKRLNKLERNRFSLFTDDLNSCFICGNKKDHLHEIFSGRNRQNSMRYGLVLPICSDCHMMYQNDPMFNEFWHKKAQLKFMEYYKKSKEEFLEIFKKNFL